MNLTAEHPRVLYNKYVIKGFFFPFFFSSRWYLMVDQKVTNHSKDQNTDTLDIPNRKKRRKVTYFS